MLDPDFAFDRRAFLLGSSALSLLAIPGASWALQANARDSALDAMLSAWFQEDLKDDPETATNLGLDVGELASLRGRLEGQSIADVAEEKARAVRRHQQIQAFGRNGLSPAGELNYDIAEARWKTAANGARFSYGSAGGRPAPYVVYQIGGSYYSIPDFLDSQHPINSKQDADFYLARLEHYAQILNQETERVQADAAKGVIPPDFVLDKTIPNLEALRATPADQSTLVRSIVRRAGEKNLGDYGAVAARIVSGPVAQAYERQIAALKAIRPKAVHDAGVWRLPQGDELYAHGLLYNTTTTLSADEIHRIGVEQVRDLHTRLDTLLRGQGYTKGTVGERLNAMNGEERFLYPNTDEGRAKLLASLNAQVAKITPRLPRMFATLPKSKVEIRRVPLEIEAGAPGGYYQGPSLDGSRPGAYYINLKDTHEWPSLGLPTLTWHEAVPGHHFQIAIAREQGDLPLYRRAGGFSAYSEGWGLYAERVADELGVYDDEPVGRIGYLQSYLFRAVRLVVDTGIHSKRWSREQAIKYMVDNAAEPEGSAVREIERYSVWPGQACAYKLGETVISRLRADAERQLGARFDIKAFHDAILLGGAMPLTVLEKRVKDQLRFS
jgi:uncharacterized protein (DUF885 family)